MEQYGPGNNVICINLHDNESTSVEAARSVLQLKGGTLIRIENQAQRIVRFRLRGQVFGFDPNRIFARTGIESTLKENGRSSPQAIEELEKFAQRLLELLPENLQCVVALHNNTEEAFSIKSYLPGGDHKSDALEVYVNNSQDVDDIVLTTHRNLYEKMASLGYNSILQDNKRAKQDGSLSVYCGENNRRYINIETQHGRTTQYQEMLAHLLDYLLPAVQPEKAGPEGTD
ncbi:MAG: hypothetical protein ACO25B_11155 [Chitinophagaceae bacterium]